MPPEFTGGWVEKLWVDMLMLLGWALTLASGFGIALCLLGGCLDRIERRRAEKGRRDLGAERRQGNAASGMRVAEATPFNPSPEEAPVVDDGVRAFLCDDTQRKADTALTHLRSSEPRRDVSGGDAGHAAASRAAPRLI